MITNVYIHNTVDEIIVYIYANVSRIRLSQVSIHAWILTWDNLILETFAYMYTIISSTVLCMNTLLCSHITATAYGKGYKGTSMLLANVGCKGSETNLTNCCATRISNNSQCHGRVHAGIRCMLEY